MRTSRMSFILVPLALLALGCQSKVAQENRDMWEQNRQLQAENTRLRNEAAASKTDSAQVAALQTQLAERDQKLAVISSPPGAVGSPEAARPTIAGVETSYDKASGNMTVNVPGDVLFAPGDATVREEARTTLDKVANSLKREYAGKHVRVEGHTDNAPIKVSKWKSNQDLSLARAASVKAYLVKKGIDAGLISTTGFGADKPKGKDRAVNRRVEIVVATR